MAGDIDTLLAKQAVTERLYSYCRAFDRLDDELALSVWHPGGTVRYGDGPVQTIDDYLPPSTAYRRSMHNCSHQITNLLIRIKGRRAVSEAYVTASLQEQPVDGRTAENLYRGRYVDRWSCRDGVWGIDHRWFVPDSYTRIEFENPFLGSGFLGQARRDREDPSYLAFAELDG